mgnify:FL=1
MAAITNKKVDIAFWNLEGLENFYERHSTQNGQKRTFTKFDWNSVNGRKH